MIDDAVGLMIDLGFDWLIGRDENRTRVRQVSLFFGIVFVLLAICLAVISGPWYGLAAGSIAIALILFGA